MLSTAAGIAWKHRMQQESEREGRMSGKNADFVGREAFGAGERKPRTPEAPGQHCDLVDC